MIFELTTFWDKLVGAFGITQIILYVFFAVFGYLILRGIFLALIRKAVVE